MINLANEAQLKNAVDIVSRGTDFPQGQQVIVRFKNGFGASIVESAFSHGTELAVIKFNSVDVYDFYITYDTHVTGDVIGYLDHETLMETLKMIEEL